MSHQFRAEVIAAGRGGHAVVVPRLVAATFSSRRPAVTAVVNGTAYESRLAVYGGQCYLGLRKDLLHRIGAAAGDEVDIELTERVERPEPRSSPTEPVSEPDELIAALLQNPAAGTAYQAMPPSHRQEYARWIAEAAQPATRNERVARTIKRLTDRSERS